MMKKLFVDLNLEALISCSEKTSAIALSFEDYSKLVSSSLEL